MLPEHVYRQRQRELHRRLLQTRPRLVRDGVRGLVVGIHGPYALGLH
jgi:hypothetical protein